MSNNVDINALVTRGAELDYIIKKLSQELDDIKNSLKLQYKKTGSTCFTSTDGETCAVVTVKSRNVINPALIYDALLSHGKDKHFFECVTVTKKAVEYHLGKEDVDACTEKGKDTTIALSFSTSKRL